MQPNQLLIDQVIEQIVVDLHNQDTTALSELLQNLPTGYLIGFLSEKE